MKLRYNIKELENNNILRSGVLLAYSKPIDKMDI